MRYTKREVEMIQGTIRDIKVFSIALAVVVIGLFVLKYYVG
ncbi:hypothetical protein BRE01_28930 [Brevibacillus reuszeri]|uniref:Uncharacterized protein n=1 Tax=Brevibacillus reuszeri TaxID=54915 RepID=A0ABQ0TMV9_9BACL|nr:hypothetical protein [Brevibacillus reuszeri]MED1858975.1 hypothetical protein [Brevibacillus reuszeri]GED69191.1 hypothetical protein BRE01_28930 [Brevibacillus reuszeri]